MRILIKHNVVTAILGYEHDIYDIKLRHKGSHECWFKLAITVRTAILITS